MTKLALMLLGFAVRISAADLSGVWDVTLKAAWTNIPALVCKLSQNGQQITGNCRAAGDPDGRAADLTGTVEGAQVSVQWQVVTPNGQTWTYALTGTLDAKETMIEGSATLSSDKSKGGGTFTAKKR